MAVCLTCWSRLALVCEVFNIFMPLLVGTLLRFTREDIGSALRNGIPPGSAC